MYHTVMNSLLPAFLAYSMLESLKLYTCQACKFGHAQADFHCTLPPLVSAYTCTLAAGSAPTSFFLEVASMPLPVCLNLLPCPVLQVVALATAIGVLKGSDSGLFAIALVLSLVVMYDASGAASFLQNENDFGVNP